MPTLVWPNGGGVRGDTTPRDSWLMTAVTGVLSAAIDALHTSDEDAEVEVRPIMRAVSFCFLTCGSV